MLMVILGAGASFDSLPAQARTGPGAAFPHFPERPPLADELFDNRPNFGEAMYKFRYCQRIVPMLQRRYGKSLEQRLQELADEATDYSARAQQLMSIRYYIQYILWNSEDGWLRGIGHGVT